MFIKDMEGGYVNVDCVEYFDVATGRQGYLVKAYMTVVCDYEQEDFCLAECESEEAAQKWLDDLMDDLVLVRRSLK